MRLIDEGGWGRDELTLLAPRAELAEVAEFFWIEEWTRRPRAGRYRIVADDAPHILWHVEGRRHRVERFGLIGARTAHHDIDVSSRVLTVGVRLRPGVLPMLLNQSARRFTDRSVPFPLPLPRRRFMSPELLVDDLTTILGEHTRRAVPAFLRRVRVLDPCARDSVGALARELGASERTLRNLSHDHLGMGLKRFMKIRRLHAAMRLHQRAPAQSWSRVASECGYADQAHLIRDCRSLLGESPATFSRRSRD
jgi:AraC-like DNA-binding protein